MENIVFCNSLSLDSAIKVGGQQYVRLFQKAGYRILYITPPLNVWKLYRGNIEDKLIIENFLKGCFEHGKNIFSFTGFSFIPYVNFPFCDSVFVSKLQYILCFPPIPYIIKKYGFTNPDILWFGDPFYYCLRTFCKPKKIVYRISDLNSEFPNLPRAVKELEPRVARKVDYVFGTSKKICDLYREVNKNTFYLPNGVDLESLIKPENAPSDICNIETPKIVYVGAIADWIDFETLHFAVTQLRNITFIFVGPYYIMDADKRRSFNELKGNSNFIWVGPKRHSAISAYLFNANIAIIPFVKNDFTDSISPVKLFEYAACGVPILAANLDEIGQYRNVVHMYHDKGEFVIMIRHILNSKRNSGELMRFAGENTWDKRFKTIESILDTHAGN